MLTEGKIEWAESQVKKWANKHNLNYRQALEILSDVESYKDLWETVYLSEFLFKTLQKILKEDE